MPKLKGLLGPFSTTLAFVALAAAPPVAAQTGRFLTQEPSIASWLPPQPQPGDRTDAEDLGTYFATRPLALPNTPTLATAQADDVLDAPSLASRFAEAVGGNLTPGNAPQLMQLMTLVLGDDTEMLTPLKRSVDLGGRVRPYVRFPDQPVCKHDVDDGTYHLNTSGSYPSGHATYGWMWGLVLSAMVPERSDAITQRAYSFGQSRLICGFHYPSDLTAGRLAASALFGRLIANPRFKQSFDLAKTQVRIALKLTP